MEMREEEQMQGTYGNIWINKFVSNNWSKHNHLPGIASVEAVLLAIIDEISFSFINNCTKNLNCCSSQTLFERVFMENVQRKRKSFEDNKRQETYIFNMGRPRIRPNCTLDRR